MQQALALEVLIAMQMHMFIMAHIANDAN